MDGDPEGLEDNIQLDFGFARLELAEARRACELDGTETARQHLGTCLARLDSVLDMWNDVLLTSV
jgi:hypothetical protein